MKKVDRSAEATVRAVGALVDEPNNGRKMSCAAKTLSDSGMTMAALRRRIHCRFGEGADMVV